MRDRTIALPSAELGELGVSRSTKNKALAQLATAGLIQIERARRGRAAKVTLLWQPK